jgi:hypothetical protein
VGFLGKAHWILTVVNNHQAEHQSTAFKTSGTVTDQILSILIDPGANKIFISSAALKIIKVKAVQDEFSFVKFSLGEK